MGLVLSSLVDEVSNTARGYTRAQDQVTSLNQSINDTTLAISVENGGLLSAGVIEIEDELCRLRAVTDAEAGLAEMEHWGRGIDGSVPVPHVAGSRVTVAPMFPRIRIKNAIEGVLREIFPDVYAVADVAFTPTLTSPGYQLGSDVWKVIAVYNRNIGPGLQWSTVRRWQEFRGQLYVHSGLSPGVDALRVQYIRTPSSNYDMTDDLAVDGYDESIHDLLVLGATAKLMAFTEPARVLTESVEASARAERVPAGSAIALSRQLYQQFQQRLDSERRQLLLKYPPQMHQTR